MYMMYKLYILNIGNKLHESAAMYMCILYMSERNEKYVSKIAISAKLR